MMNMIWTSVGGASTLGFSIGIVLGIIFSLLISFQVEKESKDSKITLIKVKYLLLGVCVGFISIVVVLIFNLLLWWMK